MIRIKRVARIHAKTKETGVHASVNLDGTGKSNISTGTHFLDHMITSFSTHSLIDVQISATGDLDHHVIEDSALALGKALSKALGERRGIARFGNACVAMDESLACVSIDLVKREYFVGQNLEFKRNYIEDIAREDLVHFLRSLCNSLECTMHVRIEYGSNDHHKAEACFKALALAMREAVSFVPRRSSVPSSKGQM